jgi:hypothetical protein
MPSNTRMPNSDSYSRNNTPRWAGEISPGRVLVGRLACNHVGLTVAVWAAVKEINFEHFVLLSDLQLAVKTKKPALTQQHEPRRAWMDAMRMGLRVGRRHVSLHPRPRVPGRYPKGLPTPKE